MKNFSIIPVLMLSLLFTGSRCQPEKAQWKEEVLKGIADISTGTMLCMAEVDSKSAAELANCLVKEIIKYTSERLAQEIRPSVPLIEEYVISFVNSWLGTSRARRLWFGTSTPRRLSGSAGNSSLTAETLAIALEKYVRRH